MKLDTLPNTSEHSSRRRRLIGIAMLGLLLWPTTLLAGGRAGGTTDSLRNKAALNHDSRIWVGNKALLPETWDIDAVTLTPWCALDGHSLLEGCEDGHYNCGKVSVPCGESLGGVEPVAAGTGLRNFREGTIPLRSARRGGQLVAAWVLWSVISSADPNAPQGDEIVFEDTELVGELLGTSDEPCWEQELAAPEGDNPPIMLKAFWVEVTDYLRPGINGDYRVTLKGSSLIDGEDPWGPTLPEDDGFEAEGATLIAVVAHPEVALESMFALHVGPSLLIGSEEYHHELPIPVPAGSQVKHIRFGGDGQVRTQRNPVTSFRTLFSPFEEHWISLRGEESSIDLHRDWQGADGGFTQLWDTQTTVTTTEQLDLLPGSPSYRIRYETNEKPETDGPEFLYDCVAVLGHGFWVGQ